MPLKDRLVKLTARYEEAVKNVTDNKGTEYVDFHARRLVEMVGHIIMSYLLLGDTTRNESFLVSAKNYVTYAASDVARHHEFIMNL